MTSGDGTADEPVLSRLARDPHPTVHRAALAARHPRWGLATMSLLVLGLVAAFTSFAPLAGAVVRRCALPGAPLCTPSAQAVIPALPVAALILGLTVALLAGRWLARRNGTPEWAALAGWALFLAGTAAALVLGLTP